MQSLIKAYGLDSLITGQNLDNFARLNDLPVALYATDLTGDIIYYNRAAVILWGKAPVKGKDKWCANYDLYTKDGRFIPKENCAMAQAVKQEKVLRGVEAVAVRPNGSAFTFLPFPTPLYNEKGIVIGAVNMIIYLGETDFKVPCTDIDFKASEACEVV